MAFALLSFGIGRVEWNIHRVSNIFTLDSGFDETDANPDEVFLLSFFLFKHSTFSVFLL